MDVAVDARLRFVLVSFPPACASFLPGNRI